MYIQVRILLKVVKYDYIIYTLVCNWTHIPTKLEKKLQLKKICCQQRELNMKKLNVLAMSKMSSVSGTFIKPFFLPMQTKIICHKSLSKNIQFPICSYKDNRWLQIRDCFRGNVENLNVREKLECLTLLFMYFCNE